MRDFLLSYDTVTLYPKYSMLPSRSNADTSLIFCEKRFNLPIVPANMVDVIGEKNAKWLSENGYFYIYHRFGDDVTSLKPLSFLRLSNEDKWKLISISVGIGKKWQETLSQAKSIGYNIDFITIDVAHAHHNNVRDMVLFIRKEFPKIKLIVGNVATKEGFGFLYYLGVDAIKTGIGGGQICITKNVTGFHIPTLQSVYDANEIMTENGWDIPIIADGGAKHYGDIAKALTMGANMVMSGGWFASCIDSPAKIVNGKKLYRGSTSYELKGHRNHIEGKQLELEEGITYEQRLNEIKQSLQSSISYAGGSDLGAFDSVKWGRIFPSFH